MRDIQNFLPAFLVKISDNGYKVMDDYDDISFASLTLRGTNGIECM